VSFTFENPADFRPEPAAESGFREALRVLSRHKLLIAFGGILGIAAAAAVMAVVPAKYTADAEVAVRHQEPDPFQQGNGPNYDANMAAQQLGTLVAALQASSVVGQVVQQLGIEAPQGFIVTHLCPIKWTPRFLCPPITPAQEFNKRIDAFQQNLSVAPVKSTTADSGAVGVSYTDRDPVFAAKVVNTLIADLQKQEIGQQANEFDRTAGWLNQRSQELRARWVAAEQAVAQFRQQHGLTQTLAGDKMAPLIGQEIGSAANQLAQAQAQLAAAQAEETALREALRGGTASAMVQLQNEPILVEMAKNLDQLEMKRSFLADTYRSGMLSQIDRQIGDTRARMAAETRRALSNIKNEVALRQAEVNRLQQNLGSLKGHYETANAPLAQLEALEREAADASTVYASFLKRSVELADRAPILAAKTEVISSAEVPALPSFPEPKKFLVGGLILGLVCGAGVAWSREKFATGFKDISRVSMDFSLPLLSIVPTLPSARRLGVPLKRYVGQRPFSAAAESVRSLGAAIALAHNAPGASTAVTVTSAVGQEGKSTLCYWLAEISAREGRSVLLVDGDYRKSAAIPRNDPPGFTDLVSGQASLESVVVKNGAGPMHFIPSGRPRIGAYLGPDLERLRVLVDEMKRHYSLVIIDAPPLMGMSEALVYASVSDQTIFVCRWQDTSRAAASSCLDRLRAAGANVTGVVLSQVDMNQVSLYSEEYDRKSLHTMRQYYLD
jgi:polysaccharide biosynthesis transport protein